MRAHFPIIHPKTLIHIDPSNEIERLLMPEKEEKEKDLLKELCGKIQNYMLFSVALYM